MKPKKISKKLTLNKSTVAVLNGNEGKKVKGGVGGMTTVQKPCDCDTKTDCQGTNGPCSDASNCPCQSYLQCTETYDGWASCVLTCKLSCDC